MWGCPVCYRSLAASLTSTYQMPVVPARCGNQKIFLNIVKYPLGDKIVSGWEPLNETICHSFSLSHLSIHSPAHSIHSIHSCYKSTQPGLHRWCSHTPLLTRRHLLIGLGCGASKELLIIKYWMSFFFSWFRVFQRLLCNMMTCIQYSNKSSWLKCWLVYQNYLL